MAKILLADDNSNVHKTVALALTSLGIEVSSVNNGDAAIKKLSDFSPDLILADIFMPVRSGYEVCEYVKKNPRFSQVPVVLLVGAFDPLDEREAQRVGADGILKKPFVPPDPLITMVKTLLHRVIGEHPAEDTTSKERAPVLAVAGKVAEDESFTASAPEDSESTEDGFATPHEFPAPSERANFSETHLPAAFSQLLEAARFASTDDSKTASEEQDQVVTSQRDATLGEPIFWKSDAPDQESQEEPLLQPASEIEIPVWSQSGESSSESIGDEGLKPLEPLEFVSEEHEQTSASIVDAQPLQLDLAAQSPLTVEPSPAEDLAANPIEWLASTSYDAVQAERTASDDAEPASKAETAQISPEVSAIPEEIVPVSIAQESETEIVPAQAPKPENITAPVSGEAARIETHTVEAEVPVTEQVEAASHSADTVDSSASPKKLDPDDTLPSVAQQWSDLSASISARANELAARPGGLSTSEQVAQMLSSGFNGATSAPLIPANNVSQDATTHGSRSPEEKEAENAKDAALVSGTASVAGSASGSGSGPDPALVEAVVQKVISKMSPQVVDIITREFLRPIVQALVHRAIEK